MPLNHATRTAGPVAEVVSSGVGVAATVAVEEGAFGLCWLPFERIPANEAARDDRDPGTGSKPEDGGGGLQESDCADGRDDAPNSRPRAWR